MEGGERHFDDVVCAVVVRHGKVLLVHRNGSRRWAPNSWDFPGGHVEVGESDLDALCRELREELGIEVDRDVPQVIGRLVGSDYDLRLFAVTSFAGEPHNCAPGEHDGLAWFELAEIGELELADRDAGALARRAFENEAPSNEARAAVDKTE